MRTYSHFLVTAALWQALEEHGTPVPAKAFLAGAVLPDVPLGLLSVGYVVDRRFVRTHLPDKTRCSPSFNDLYFNNPYWIAGHNALHAPLPVLTLGLTGFAQRDKAWGWSLLWFAAAAGLHSLIDIFSHADDGPVLLFPLEWHGRFNAPVSYWDPEHYGKAFRLAEHVLDALLAGYLLWRRGLGR